MEERLQKILSRAGICSRRRAEDYLLEGRVKVNGRIAKLGDKADIAQDEILLDGNAVFVPQEKTYLMLNKPRGYVTTLSDEHGRRTVADLVSDCGVRVWPVGRLDYDTEGLLLLSNDGDFTHFLLHPSHLVEKEYHAWVRGDVAEAIPILCAPMEVDGEVFSGARVFAVSSTGGQTVLSITIHEGRNRQVRKMCKETGLDLGRLQRVREGALLLDRELKSGAWRRLSDTEVSLLCKKV